MTRDQHDWVRQARHRVGWLLGETPGYQGPPLSEESRAQLTIAAAELDRALTVLAHPRADDEDRALAAPHAGECPALTNQKED